MRKNYKGSFFYNLFSNPIILADTLETLDKMNSTPGFFNNRGQRMFSEDRKICNVCHKSFPRTEKYWFKNPNAADGLIRICKKCKVKKESEV